MSTFYHAPVLVGPVTELMADTPEGILVDGTLGGGGHTLALAERLGPDRPLVGVDQDQEALDAAADRLGAHPRVRLLQGNFRALPALLRGALGPRVKVAGILVDLGVSSWQLDSAARGFGLKHEAAPLDMRMDPAADRPTAHDLIADLDAEALGRVLADYGEVRGAFALARRLKDAVVAGGLSTTGDLARLVAAVQKTPRNRRVHPATQVFQALRIAVNDELGALDDLLAAAPELLVPGGRLVVIAYHSLEDRRVKQAFKLGAEGPPRPRGLPMPTGWRPTWALVTRKPIRPDEAEIEANPRARSARLRAAARPAPAGGDA